MTTSTEHTPGPSGVAPGPLGWRATCGSCNWESSTVIEEIAWMRLEMHSARHIAALAAVRGEG